MYIYIYISHRKYQVKSQSPPLPKVKLRQVSKSCKGVLEAAKIGHANETQSLSFSRNLAHTNFGQLLKMILW